MSEASLTEADIRPFATQESFERGRAYYKRGAVLSLVRRGEILQAVVEGSEGLPYDVYCHFGADGSRTTTCSCPYDRGGWCKHSIAACLAMIHQPGLIVERPTLTEVVSHLDLKQLRSLVLKLVEEEPSLIEKIEQLVPKPPAPATPPTPAPARAKVDAKEVRQQVRSIIQGLARMHSSEAYWHIGGTVDAIRNLLERVWMYIKEGDGSNALIVLNAITDEYVDNWTLLDDSDGEGSDFFQDLGPIWTEALLSTELSEKERKSWARKLSAWQNSVDDYGVEDAFTAAREAALRGWDDPELQSILQGTFVASDETDNVAPELTVARLHVLERRGQFQEYLNLAKIEGQREAYVTMLVQLDRIQEAVDYGHKYLMTAQQAFTLAQALYEHGEREHSLQIAEAGLNLQEPRTPLAKWLRDEAAKLGEKALALTAAEVAFHEELSLANYLRAAEIDRAQWPELRPKLLEYARHHKKSYVPEGQVDIFLYERLIDDAIAAVEDGATHTLVERVADAAIKSHPEWVIKVSRQQAEPIMDEGKAQYYDAAAKWLARARVAYQNMGNYEEWRTYLADLLARHQRKYKLVPMLKDLR